MKDYYDEIPSKGFKKTAYGPEDDADRGGSVDPGFADGIVNLPAVTREQQQKVIQRLADQKRLKIYRPERG